MTDTTLQDIEQEIADAKEVVALGDALDRLEANRDFRKILTQGFMQDEAVRLVHLKADPNMQTPDRQQSILQQIDAIGTLAEYFRTLRHRAELAKKTVAFGEEQRELMVLEGGAE